MRTTTEEIRTWFIEGLTRIELNNEDLHYMIVECDTFSHEDYPVYLSTKEEVRKRLKEHKAHEVYDLDADIDEQLAMRRCWAVR